MLPLGIEAVDVKASETGLGSQPYCSIQYAIVVETAKQHTPV